MSEVLSVVPVLAEAVTAAAVAVRHAARSAADGDVSGEAAEANSANQVMEPVLFYLNLP